MPGDSRNALRNALPYGTLEAITGGETLLVLAPGPGDESILCGGLIAESCRRGRPPFVMVLGDGTSAHAGPAGASPDAVARLHDRETRRAVGCLGLPDERLLMAGLYDGQIPRSGPVFDAVVRAVTLVMWARDCNVLCAPWPHAHALPGERATYRIAEAVCAASGVGLLAWAPEDPPPASTAGWRLDITPWLGRKRQALAAHAARGGAGVLPGLRNHEVFLRPVRPG